tara:strand:- start:98 stop:328 length:231 start_codon:yes stop_codon:yes gene_type:complete
MDTVLQITEEQFRKTGKHGDTLIGILRDLDELIENNIMYIRTNLIFELNVPEIAVFNQYLRKLRSQNIIMVQVILD